MKAGSGSWTPPDDEPAASPGDADDPATDPGPVVVPRPTPSPSASSPTATALEVLWRHVGHDGDELGFLPCLRRGVAVPGPSRPSCCTR